MKARSVARELALFTLFQLEKKGGKLDWDKTSLQELLVNTIRALTSLAEEQIETIAQEVQKTRDFILDYELRHPDNEKVPLEAPTLAVTLPTSHEMNATLEALLQAVANLQEALYLPEIKILSEREDVQNYCAMLVKNVVSHQAEIDALIQEASTDWRVERIQKMDLMLIRLALAELKYTEKIDAATVIDECVELAKRFTDEDGRKFIHGILGQITQTSTPEVIENV